MKIIYRVKKQQGAALVVSLIILVAMTMLGITSMKSTISELAMAGNLRESGKTFQAAEAGLGNAEDFVEDNLSINIYDGSPSLLGEADADPNYLNYATWGAATSATVSLAGISTNPQYIIKYLGKWHQNPKAQLNTGSGYGGQPPGITTTNYRVTSRGTGESGKSARIVQSYYGK